MLKFWQWPMSELALYVSRKYKIRDQDKLYFVTFAVIRWLDVFTRNLYKDIFLDSLRYCQENKGLELCAYCIMTNHIHMIIGRNKEVGLDAIIRDLKKLHRSKSSKPFKTTLTKAAKNCFHGFSKRMAQTRATLSFNSSNNNQ